MSIIKYDTLADNYLPTDGSVPIAIPRESTELTLASGEASTALSLEGYQQIAIIFENDTTVDVDYVELLGNQSTDSTIEIVKDATASSGYALKITGAQTLVFGTPISYVPNILKKVTCKAKTDGSGTLYASVVAYKNGIYNGKTSTSLSDYVKVALDGSEVLETSYNTYTGYIKGTGTNYVEHSSNTPDTPSELPEGTDEIALVLESTGGIFYVDVISLEEVENSIRDIPDGNTVYTSAVNFNTRNDRISATPNTPAITTPSTYTLNADGTVDIEFIWTFDNTGDAGNIDGFVIFEHSATDDTAPVFTIQQASYIDATSRSYTIRNVVINKWYTVGVQAYRYVDADIHVNEILKSSLVQSTPYRPSSVVPSTTTYCIQPNVATYLGSEVLGSIYIHGYYFNNTRGDIDGKIIYNSADTALYLAVPKGVVDCTDFTLQEDNTTVYLVLDGGVVKPTIYDINTQSLYNNTETVTTGVIIGEIVISYDISTYTIVSTNVYSEASTINAVLANQINNAWKYLSSAVDAEDWANKVDDLGLENAFTFLAAYKAFINNLTVNTLKVDNPEETDPTKQFVVDVNKNDGIKMVYGGEKIFHSSIAGKVTMRNAEVVGTLRTGEDAPIDARVAVRDDAGIISGPTFTGSGLDDLSILQAASVADVFKAEITGVGNGNFISTTLTILSSFNSPGIYPSGLTFDGTNLISCDTRADKIYVHDGISSTILSSFNSPGIYSSGLTFDGTNLISCDTGSDKIYVHSLIYTFSDRFKWSVGAFLSAELYLDTGETFTLDDGTTDYGITITFDSPYGHTLGDYWEFEQGAMNGMIIQDSSGVEYLKASGGVVTATKLYGAVFN